MGIVWRDHQNGVQLGLSQHLLNGLIGGDRLTKLLDPTLTTVSYRVLERDYLRLRMEFQVANMLATHHSNASDAEAKLIHARSP